MRYCYKKGPVAKLGDMEYFLSYLIRNIVHLSKKFKHEALRDIHLGSTVFIEHYNNE